TLAEVRAKNWEWHEEDTRDYLAQSYVIPNEISETPESITSEILACEKCQRNYRIIEAEFNFYQQLQVPIPHKCPECRHYERMSLRNPRKLWARVCENCKKGLQSTYAPERSEKIYCEECYTKEVF